MVHFSLVKHDVGVVVLLFGCPVFVQYSQSRACTSAFLLLYAFGVSPRQPTISVQR